MEIEIYWHPRVAPDGRPFALAVHVEYSMGSEFHTSVSNTLWGAGGLNVSPLSIFELITIAIEEAQTARVLMLASTQGRLMAATTVRH